MDPDGRCDIARVLVLKAIPLTFEYSRVLSSTLDYFRLLSITCGV